MSSQGIRILSSRRFSTIFPQGLTNSMASVVMRGHESMDETVVGEYVVGNGFAVPTTASSCETSTKPTATSPSFEPLTDSSFVYSPSASAMSFCLQPYSFRVQARLRRSSRQSAFLGAPMPPSLTYFTCFRRGQFIFKDQSLK